MRRVIIAAWCFVPILFLGFHYGTPGKRLQTLDQIDQMVQNAKYSVGQEEWETAVTQFEEALAIVPKEMVTESGQIHL